MASGLQRENGRATMLKIAMFDEVDEGTAILKAVPHRTDAPEQGYWLRLDADGQEISNDHGEIKPSPRLPAR